MAVVPCLHVTRFGLFHVHRVNTLQRYHTILASLLTTEVLINVSSGRTVFGLSGACLWTNRSFKFVPIIVNSTLLNLFLCYLILQFCLFLTNSLLTLIKLLPFFRVIHLLNGKLMLLQTQTDILRINLILTQLGVEKQSFRIDNVAPFAELVAKGFCSAGVVPHHIF